MAAVNSVLVKQALVCLWRETASAAQRLHSAQLAIDSEKQFLERIAAGQPQKNTSPGRRKVIIIISWSHQPLIMAETHLHKAAEVTELLDRTGTTVYSLYLTEERRGGFDPIDDFPFTPKKMRRRSGGTVEQFVEQTGGSVLVGERARANDLLIRLTGLIGSSYTIGYYPENSDFDGRFRGIRLELSGRGKAKAGKVNIKTRKGYRALRPSLADTSELKN